MVGMKTKVRDATLHEIIAWCEQIADKELDMYRAAYGDDRQAIAVRGAYWAVAAHCREMLVHGGSMPLEVENQSEDAK